MQRLGHVPDRHDWLGYPDGQVADGLFEQLVGEVASFLAEERPDVVVTFGPDGITGHPGPRGRRPRHRRGLPPGAHEAGTGLRRLLH